MNPTVNKSKVLLRVAAKIERAASRIGFLSAMGTQAVLRCNGVALRMHGRTIIETGECAIVASLPVTSGMVN